VRLLLIILSILVLASIANAQGIPREGRLELENLTLKIYLRNAQINTLRREIVELVAERDRLGQTLAEEQGFNWKEYDIDIQTWEFKKKEVKK